jgi:hypothetical protein
MSRGQNDGFRKSSSHPADFLLCRLAAPILHFALVESHGGIVVE